MTTRDRPTRLAAVALIGLVLASCGSGAVEQSSEYEALAEERDQLAADFESAQQELTDVSDELDEIDDRLAVVESQLTDANATVAANEAIVTDLSEVLAVDLVNRAGFSQRDADCVVDGFLADGEVRASYLMLIGPDPIDDQDAAEAALDEVNVVLTDCGIEIGGAADDPPPPSGPPIEEMLRDVDVVGDALPQFTEQGDPAIGLAAPVLVGETYEGEPLTIDASADGPTMLIFLAHWCPHCNAEVPKLVQLRDEGRIPDGVNVAAVSSLVNPTRANYPPDAWLADAGFTFPTLADGVDASGDFLAADAFGLRGVPYVILIDGDGRVTDRWAGERAINEIAGALESLAP